MAHGNTRTFELGVAGETIRGTATVQRLFAKRVRVNDMLTLI